jgi:VWFA-related protein
MKTLPDIPRELRNYFRLFERVAASARVVICLTVLLASTVHASTRLLVTVTDPRTGDSVTDLKAGDFAVLDDKTPRTVETAELTSEPVDIMLLLDTSLVGEAVQPLAGNLIQQLDPKEQMAVISFASSADLVQDFTSSRGLLTEAVRRMKYGNTPQVLDALYASIDGGFGSSPFRRVVVLLTTGLEGGSSVTDKEVIRLARKNAVSIFPVYLAGSGRWLFDELARQTGGAGFRVGDLRHMKNPQPGPQIFAALRKHYLLTISGNYETGPKLKIRVNGQDKLFASALPLE